MTSMDQKLMVNAAQTGAREIMQATVAVRELETAIEATFEKVERARAIGQESGVVFSIQMTSPACAAYERWADDQRADLLLREGA